MDETVERAKDGPQTVGARLRAAREERGQSLDDIGRQTRVPVRHLLQIEEGHLEGLPAAPYSAGFVKAYARAVDLDPTALSQQFRAEFDRANRATPRVAYEPYEPADPKRLPPRLLAYVALAIAVLLVASYAVLRSGIFTGDTRDARSRLAANGPDVATTAAPPQPGATTPAAQAPAPAATPAGGPVRLVALQPVWLKVSERNGATLFMGELAQGKSYDVPPTAQDPVLRTGRPEALQAQVGGKPVGPLGTPAHTVSNVSLKADALLGRPGADAAAAAPAPAAAPSTAVTAPPANADGSVPTAFRDATQP
jgi:cytoskeletal protein RodZ